MKLKLGCGAALCDLKGWVRRLKLLWVSCDRALAAIALAGMRVDRGSWIGSNATMKALLDTHTPLWWVTNDARLPQTVHDVINIADNTL
ncbi:MAG: type II toxin-antitoxin system VapC family toxin [Leptolyngbyaceae cyanobacterium RU_5_1]|nr:type II toxin-antitoxin system VapC family toxin [Leptolyngbyaceae cyanobacterium RU_5_1]